MTSFREILIATEDALEEANIYCGHGFDSAHDEAVALVLAAAGLSLTETGSEILDESVSNEALSVLEQYVHRRCQDREPTAYITGEAYFGPLRFICDRRALVPRSPIAELVESSFDPWLADAPPEVIVDVCCGGGSLGLLAQTIFPDASVVLSDLDGPALSLAAENRQLHEAPVGLIQGDLLSWLADDSTDVILANPPYVDAEDMATLPPEYLHEPQLALDGGLDGLDLVHSLLIDAERALKQNGLLILEVGNSLEAFDAISTHLNPVWVELAYGGHGVAILTKTELSIWRGMTDNLGSRVGV